MGGDARAAAKEVVEKKDARTLHDLAGVIKAFEGGMLSASTALAAIRHLVGDEVRVFLPQMERMGIPGPLEKLYDYHQPGSRLTRPPIMATHMSETKRSCHSYDTSDPQTERSFCQAPLAS